MGHAKAIAGIAPEEQLKALKKCIKKALSVRQMELLARKLSESPKKSSTSEDEEYPESYTRLVEYLESFFSQNISIKRTKSGGGKITIGFDNDSDIDRFIERFSKK